MKTRGHRGLTLTLIAGSLSTALYGLLAAATAVPSVASEGTDGCVPYRSASLDNGAQTYYRFDGWQYTNAGPLGGTTALMNTYSPYVPSDQVLAWSMLQPSADSSQYAQVGYTEFPGNSGGSTRWFIFLGSGPKTQGQQIGSYMTWAQPNQSVHPAVDSWHSYTTLWGYYQALWNGGWSGPTYVGEGPLG